VLTKPTPQKEKVEQSKEENKPKEPKAEQPKEETKTPEPEITVIPPEQASQVQPQPSQGQQQKNSSSQ